MMTKRMQTRPSQGRYKKMVLMDHNLIIQYQTSAVFCNALEVETI